jgi:hypothetical protein
VRGRLPGRPQADEPELGEDESSTAAG